MPTRISNSNMSNAIVLPKIVIASYTSHNLSNHNITEIILDSDIPESIAFNKVLETNKAQIYGFLSRYDSFINDSAILKILDIFNQFDFVNFVYSDIISIGKNFEQKQFLPSNLNEHNNIVCLSPIFIRGLKPKFNEKLKSFYFHDMLYRLHQMSFGHHIADFLYYSEKHPLNTEDLEIIYGQSN